MTSRLFDSSLAANLSQDDRTTEETPLSHVSHPVPTQDTATDVEFGPGPPATLCEAFYRTAGRVPDRVAVVADDGTEMTWGEYGSRARNVAAGLH
jgi:non-ribosomal peptide synthetase component E (peptide arylation enzyme)